MYIIIYTGNYFQDVMTFYICFHFKNLRILQMRKMNT